MAQKFSDFDKYQLGTLNWISCMLIHVGILALFNVKTCCDTVSV